MRTPLLWAPPRLFAWAGWRGGAANLAALGLFGALGAALVHLAAYHLRASLTGAYLIRHCPWRPALALILGLALANGLLLHGEVARLWRERRQLAAGLHASPGAGPAFRAPRRPARLAILFLCLYAIELGTTSLSMAAAPMRAPARMGGHEMLMAVAPIFPLGLGQALVAGIVALLLWRCERRIRVLRRIVAVLRLLLVWGSAPSHSLPTVAGPSALPPCLLHGFRIFSRPPPAGSLARQ